MEKAEAHASALQDLLSLSPGSWGAAQKKAMLSRLELQYALALLRLSHEIPPPPPGTVARSIDLERGAVKLSSHISGALALYRGGRHGECASELYAADALVSKMVPRLKRESKK